METDFKDIPGCVGRYSHGDVSAQENQSNHGQEKSPDQFPIALCHDTTPITPSPCTDWTAAARDAGSAAPPSSE